MAENFIHQPATNGTEPIGEYLSFSVQDPAWFRHMNCEDPLSEEFFTKVKGVADPLNLKEKYCDRCPVAEDCLAADILQGVSTATIRGGVGHGERQKMRRSMDMNRTYIPSHELPHYRYRNAGFTGQMAMWRAGLVGEIHDKERVVFSIEKQIEAGTVLQDGYYDARASELESLRQQLRFIDTEVEK